MDLIEFGRARLTEEQHAIENNRCINCGRRITAPRGALGPSGCKRAGCAYDEIRWCEVCPQGEPCEALWLIQTYREHADFLPEWRIDA